MLSIQMYNYSINTTIIITTILIIGVNLISISFSSANAQNNGFRLEQIQHMMGPGPHMMGPGPHRNMMENRIAKVTPIVSLPLREITQ